MLLEQVLNDRLAQFVNQNGDKSSEAVKRNKSRFNLAAIWELMWKVRRAAQRTATRGKRSSRSSNDVASTSNKRKARDRDNATSRKKKKRRRRRRAKKCVHSRHHSRKDGSSSDDCHQHVRGGPLTHGRFSLPGRCNRTGAGAIRIEKSSMQAVPMMAV